MRFFISKSLKDYLFLLLVAVIAYWPVSFMVFSLKNDAINYFLAMRYNTSEAIQYGYFPSWSAYINMGYPMHADMQSGVWNPLVILMSLIRKYDIYWLQVETILAIFFSGVSMYHLLKYLKFERRIILMIAGAYMFNGFISDSGQFINWIYGATILPFVFMVTLKSFTDFKMKDAFLLGLAHALMFLCAYPADFILLSYGVFFFVVCSFIKDNKRNKSRAILYKYGKQVLLTIVSFILISLPAIISYLPFLELMNRGSGVDLETALSNSLAPANLLSFVTPWATQKGAAFQFTDPLIRNCYIGLILFIFFILYFFQKREKGFFEKFLIGLFCVFLLFSLGKLGGIRVLTFHWLPLMNTFRHPANAKLFFIFAGQVLAAFALKNYFKKEISESKLAGNICIFLLTISSVLLVLSFFNSNFFSVFKSETNRPGQSVFDTIKIIKDNLTFYDLFFINLALAITTLSIFLYLVRKNNLRKYILWLVLIEMAIVVQGMIPLTYVRNAPPSQVQQIIDQQPKGYPLPDNKMSIEEFSRDGMKYFDIIGCLNPYNKKPGRSDYIITPANLLSQLNYWYFKDFSTKINKYPLVYFADTIYAVRDTANFISSSSHKKAAILEGSPGPMAQEHELGVGTINFQKFVPGKFIIEAHNSNPGLLVLFQNYYPDWKVYINGKKATILKANISFMAVVLPPGTNNVEFKFQTNYLKYITIFSLLFLLSGLIFAVYKRKSNSK